MQTNAEIETFTHPSPLRRWYSAGGIVVQAFTAEGIDKILMVKPSNGFNRGIWTFPKGRADQGETLAQAAFREVAEESGRFCEILPRGRIGVEIGQYNISTYYLMIDRGAVPQGHDNETEAVAWVPLAEVLAYLARDPQSARDLRIAKKAARKIRAIQRIIRLTLGT